MQDLHPAWCSVVAALVYAWSVSFGYVAFDDPWLIKNNPLLAPGADLDLGRLFFDFSAETRMALGAEYLPLRDVSIWFDGWLFGSWVGGRHLVNVVLYAVAVGLFGQVCARVFSGLPRSGRWCAWSATIIFAVHPAHVEAVAWLSERKGLLSSGAVFAAVLYAERFCRLNKPRFAAAALCFYAVAVLSKSVAVVTPVAIGALIFVLQTNASKRRALALAAVGLAVGALLIQPTLWVGSELSVIQPEHRAEWVPRLLLFFEIHGRYLALMFLGAANAAHYPVDPENVRWAFAALGGLGLAVALSMLFVRRISAVRLGLAWWLVFLFPVSHLVFPLQNLMADRYLFLPSAGFAVAIAALLSQLSARIRNIPAALYCVFALALTVLQLPQWKDSEALFSRLAELQPAVDTHWNQWAAELQRQGRPEEAWAITNMGVQHAGETPVLLHRRGLLRLERGNAEGGFREIKRAATAPGAKPKYQANYALLLAQRGRVQEAVKLARVAAERAPLYAHIQRVLGLVELRAGNVEKATLAFERALRLEPNNPVNHRNLEAARRSLAGL